MVSIIPAERGPWDVISKAIGQNLSQNLPGAVQRGYERGLGLNAIDQAEQSMKQGVIDPETGLRRDLDPFEMALQFTRLGTVNENLQRSLGPLLQTAMQGNKVNRAFPQAGQQPAQPGMGQQGQPSAQNQMLPQGQAGEEPYKGALKVGEQTPFLTPSPFNIPTPQEIIEEGKRYAQAVLDPNAAAGREQQLRNQAETATQQRNALEDLALKTREVSPAELPRFMQIGAQFDTRNPNEWVQKTKRAFDLIKNNDTKIERAFIPGIGQALMGQNREEALERLIPSSQDQKKLGLEPDLRKYYTDQYMSPAEIENQFYPLSPQKKKVIEKFPKGLFPHDSEIDFSAGFPTKKSNPIISYEEALEKAPNELKKMQNQLSDFFNKNVDDDTSLLVLGNKLWEKNYDWRQLGPAVREAMEKGLKLNARQSTELTDLETNPPRQSLPHIFRNFSQFHSYIRGNK